MPKPKGPPPPKYTDTYYGMKLSQAIPEIMAEMLFFREANNLIEKANTGYSGDGKLWHLKKFAQMVWPREFEMNSWAEQQLEMFCDYAWSTVTGPAAGGKTTAAAIYALAFWACAPKDTAVIVCSSTVPGLRRRIWKEIKRFFAIVKPIFPEANLVESKLAIQTTKNDDSHGLFGIAVASGLTEKALGRIIGFHPKRLLIVIDEMTDTPEAIVEACVNLSKTEGEFQLIGIGNAKSIFDAHGKMCEPKAGWSSINVESDFWETKNGACLHLDGIKNPNILAGRDRYPYLLTQRQIDLDKRMYGESSPKFWRFVRGFWAPQGLENNVISEAMCVRFGVKRPAVWQRNFTNVAGLDWAYGGDRCVLKFARYGMGDNGKQIIEFIGQELLTLDTGSQEPLHFQIARQVKQHCRQRGVAPNCFGMDATGGGSGTADILAREWSPRIQRVEFGGKPSDRPVTSTNPRTCREEYYNFVTELWFSVRKFVENDQIRSLPDEDAVEFCSRIYVMRGDKIMVETKEEMKLRTGKSPDLADAVAVVCEVCRRNGVIVDDDGAQVDFTPEHQQQQVAEDAFRRRQDVDSLDDCYMAQDW